MTVSRERGVTMLEMLHRRPPLRSPQPNPSHPPPLQGAGSEQPSGRDERWAPAAGLAVVGGGGGASTHLARNGSDGNEAIGR